MKKLITILAVASLGIASCGKDDAEPQPEITQSFRVRDTEAGSNGYAYNFNNNPVYVDHFELRDSAISLTNYYTRYIQYKVLLRFASPLAQLTMGKFRVVKGEPAALNEVAVRYTYYNNPVSLYWLPTGSGELTLGRENGKLWVNIPAVMMSPTSSSGAVLELSGAAKQQ